MTERLRQPALMPPPIQAAVPRLDNPGTFLEAHYQQLWETRMRGLPFVNPALEVAAVGFRQHEGDWLGVVVTPWFLNLFLISGGGRLWGDIPAGERRYLNLPCGTLQFLADDDPHLGPYQYCPLIAPVSGLVSMEQALTAARDALTALLSPPPQLPTRETPPPAPAPETLSAAPVGETAREARPSRRAFFRRLAGR